MNTHNRDVIDKHTVVYPGQPSFTYKLTEHFYVKQQHIIYLHTIYQSLGN